MGFKRLPPEMKARALTIYDSAITRGLSELNASKLAGLEVDRAANEVRRWVQARKHGRLNQDGTFSISASKQAHLDELHANTKKRAGIIVKQTDDLSVLAASYLTAAEQLNREIATLRSQVVNELHMMRRSLQAIQSSYEKDRKGDDKP